MIAHGAAGLGVAHLNTESDTPLIEYLLLALALLQNEEDVVVVQVQDSHRMRRARERYGPHRKLQELPRRNRITRRGDPPFKSCHENAHALAFEL